MQQTISQWNSLQGQVVSCTLCKKQFPKVPVDYPPGPLYPPPPQPVKILFVGVAPPEKRRQFWIDPNDNLRRGLFAILSQLGWPCNDLNDFLHHGFFLVHTAKCARKGTVKPSLRISRFCSSLYLEREIELLLPDGVCWLSKKVGHPVAQELSRSLMGQDHSLPFGQVAPVTIKNKEILFLATVWPGMRWLAPTTQCHLAELLNALGSKSP